MNSLRVILIEDHRNFRDGLKALLDDSSAFSCIGAFGSAEEAFKFKENCDLILLDINLPGKSGVESLPLLKTNYPDARIIMLTVLEDDDMVFAALLSGADGYLLKKTNPALIPAYLEDAYNGGSPMHPVIARKVIEHFRNEKPDNNDYDLTSRESEILQLLTRGDSNRQIAEKLFISYETVRNHIKHIYEKMHVNSKSQAVAKALGNKKG